MGEESETISNADAFVTEGGDLISASKMARHAFSTKQDGDDVESRQIGAEDRFKGDFDQYGLRKPPHNLETLAHLPEINTPHYRASKTKALDTVGHGWHLEDVSDGDSEGSSEEKERILSLLKEPDPEHTKLSFEEVLQRTVYDHETIGNGYLEIKRRDPDEDPKGIAHVPGQTVRRKTDDLDIYAQKRYLEISWFKSANAQFDIDYETGETGPLGSMKPDRVGHELIHFRNYSTRSDYYGLPDNLSALAAILGTREAQIFNVDFFENYGIPSYAVTVTGADLGPKVKQTIRDYFKDDAKNNPHSTLVLTVETDDPDRDVEISFEPLSVDMKEGHFRMYKADNRDEVLSAHGVPPYRAAVVIEGQLGQNVARETTKIYNHSVIQPRQQKIERRLNQLVLRQMMGIEDWRFRLNQLSPADREFEEQKLQQRLQNGVITPNEYREMADDLEPKDDEDALNEHYLNGMPITGPNANSATPAVQRSMKNIEQFNDEVQNLKNGLTDAVMSQREDKRKQNGEE